MGFCFNSSSSLYSFPLKSIIFITFKLPFVIVPVLSVKRVFIFPAVSIPVSFLTSTLLFNILFILDERTSVIIIGSPSGTATTIIVTLRVSACKMCPIISGRFVRVSFIKMAS